MKAEQIRKNIQTLKKDKKFTTWELAEIAKKMKAGETDFETDFGDWRFINDDVVYKTLNAEIVDTETLAWLPSSIISGITGTPELLIEAIHKESGTAIDPLNAYLTSDEALVERLTGALVDNLGYGYFFAEYDDETHSSQDFYYFKLK